MGCIGEELIFHKLKDLSTNVKQQVKVNNGGLTRTGKESHYKIDLVTDTAIYEVKTCVRGGTPEKLGDAVHRLGINGEILDKHAFLVVNGAAYEHHVKHDPAFLRALSQEPRVSVLTYKDFN